MKASKSISVTPVIMEPVTKHEDEDDSKKEVTPKQPVEQGLIFTKVKGGVLK
jgi:hypothetical protein